ncbi:MAG: DUF1549 domain-containing protein, partial [Planctomycetaceae bacterium]
METNTKRSCSSKCTLGTPAVTRHIVLLLTSFAILGEARGADLDFDRDVAGILATHCLECHNASQSQGQLDLSSKSAAERGGEHGPAFIPGAPLKSRLWQRITAGEMPPETQLPAAAKSTIKDWIQSGARWGTDPIDPFQYSTDRRAGYGWWSLQRLRDVEPPAIADDARSHNAVDRFIMAKLAEADLQSARRADPRTLVRRLYFDLIGLPPSIEAMRRFEGDPSQAAWARLVDELLESPYYGERWAQHWLDVARFGESEGYEYNVPREHAWHYRDWVIRSLNNDLPYDQFARMQLAGDVLKPNTMEGAAAVGFLVAGVHNTVLGKSEVMRRSSRHEELQEMLGTTTQAFLGLTVNCARCHDHKFDPISNREYYELLATLDGITHGTRNVGPTSDASEVDAWARKQSELTTRLHDLVKRRGGKLSRSVNAVRSTTGLAANTAGVSYTVSLRIAPTVWADARQATTTSDGIILKVLRPDGSTLAEKLLSPMAWAASGNKQRFEQCHFEYTGDGKGAIQIEIGSTPATGRFGGAIDDLQ